MFSLWSALLLNWHCWGCFVRWSSNLTLYINHGELETWLEYTGIVFVEELRRVEVAREDVLLVCCHSRIGNGHNVKIPLSRYNFLTKKESENSQQTHSNLLHHLVPTSIAAQSRCHSRSRRRRKSACREVLWRFLEERFVGGRKGVLCGRGAIFVWTPTPI